MSMHKNCHHCGTSEPIRVLFMPDTAAITTAITTTFANIGLGPAAKEAAEQFSQFEIALRLIGDIQRTLVILEEPTDPRINLAPNHQDYTPNHRKQRRSKFKRSSKR